MECPVRWLRDCLSGPHLLVPFLSCGFDAGRGHSYFCFFFLPISGFFLISPRLDFSFYNVVIIPELCYLFYNNRGHYTGLILVLYAYRFKYSNEISSSTLCSVVLLKVKALPNGVTSCHWQSKLRGACEKGSLFRLKRQLGGPLTVRDCALTLCKYAIFFVPECGVPRQVVKRLSIGPAPSGAFPLVRVRCRPGALLLFFFLPISSFFLISPRLDFSFYNVLIPELCFLFYNNRGHYAGLILVLYAYRFKYSNEISSSTLCSVVLLKVKALPNGVTSCHWQSKLRGTCEKGSLFWLKRQLGGPLTVRDCALVLYKYAIFFVPECGVARQVVKRLSIEPAPSGAFPLVRVRCRPGALLLLFFFSPYFKFFLDIPAPRFLVL